MQFSTFVQNLRRQRGLTMRELATKAHFLPGYISLVESGQKTPRITNALRLCRALGVDVGALSSVTETYQVHGAAKNKGKKKVTRGEKH